MGAFKKFPDFFVRAFKIVVDSWKFSMLLLYILWDDWPIFMILGSNEQLQQQLEYTLLKPVVYRTLFSDTDITNSLAEPHFKATRRIVRELLKVNTANWLGFRLKYKVFDKYNSSTKKKDSEQPCLG